MKLPVSSFQPTAPEAVERLATVYWIGGSPCAGKSSIASLLSERSGLQVYRCDDAYDDHRKRALPERHPTIHGSLGMTWEQVWMRPVEVMIEQELRFYREEFELILQDLLALPGFPPILAEGSSLLPECVAPLLVSPRRAIWVVPTEEFQRLHYPRRPWVEEILRQCRDPETAFRNWMARDAGFARRVARSAREFGLRVLEVDGASSVGENASTVAAHFGLERTG